MTTDSDAAPSQPGKDEDSFDLRRVIRNGIITIVVMVVGIASLGYVLREPLMQISKGFVDTLGGFGVALGFFLPDGFMVPIPNDLFLALGLAGGMDYWSLVFWGTLGSLAGGVTGFGIGRLLRRTRWMRRFLKRRGAETRALVRRYGSLAIAIAALTPLPYSIACWTAGAMGMDFWRFMTVSLLRVARVAFYLKMIQLGLVTVLG